MGKDAKNMKKRTKWNKRNKMKFIYLLNQAITEKVSNVLKL